MVSHKKAFNQEERIIWTLFMDTKRTKRSRPVSRDITQDRHQALNLVNMREGEVYDAVRDIRQMPGRERIC